VSETTPAGTSSAFRARSAFEIIDASIQLLRRHYPKLLTLSAIMYVPMTLISLYITIAFTQPLAEASGAGATATMPSFGVGILVAYLAMLVWWAVMDSALIAASADAYVGRPVSPGGAISRAASVIGSVIAANIIKWILIGIGSLFFLVPGIYLFARWFAVPADTVIERLGPGASLARSSVLSKDNKLRILGTLIVAWLIYAAVVYMIYIPAMLSGNMVVTTLAGLVVGAFLYPLIPVVTTVLYFDLRIRKEGYDIQLMSQSMDAGAAA
jgi:hypothetical protein